MNRVKQAAKQAASILMSIVLLVIVAIGTLMLWYTWVKFIVWDHWQASLSIVMGCFVCYLVSLWAHHRDRQAGRAVLFPSTGDGAQRASSGNNRNVKKPDRGG